MTGDDDKLLLSLGALIGQIPEVGELVAYRRSLAFDLESEEARRLVLDRARELGLAPGGERLVTGTELPASVLDGSLWDLLQALLVELTDQRGELTLRDALLWLSERAGIDDFIVDYVEQSVTTGEPAPFIQSIKGGVVPVTLPMNDGEPMVFAIATPYSDMGELIREFRDQSYRAFRDYPTHEAETYEEATRVLEYQNQDMTRSQIAWQLLADRYEEIDALSDEERKRQYAPEHAKEMARLRQMIRRL